jgi:hypothetical protein
MRNGLLDNWAVSGVCREPVEVLVESDMPEAAETSGFGTFGDIPGFISSFFLLPSVLHGRICRSLCAADISFEPFLDCPRTG